MAITIEDVAREANVSISSISRVINGSKSVSPQLRLRVDAAIEKTGYRPNALARSLIINRTYTVGLVVYDISNPVMAVIAKGINSVCQRSGYTVMICETGGKRETELHLLEKLSQQHIDGLVFSGVSVDRALADRLLAVDYPVVMVNLQESDGQTRIETISCDNCRAMYDATAMLIASGHRKIAMIGGQEDDYTAGRLRVAGYRQALGEAGIEEPEGYMQYGDFSFESGYQAMQRIYEECFELPTAVVVASDLMAVGTMKSAVNLGLSVPEDMSIIGFDDSELSRYTTPALSTVRVPYFEEGVQAAETLLARIENPQAEPKLSYVPHKVIRRGSIRRMK